MLGHDNVETRGEGRRSWRAGRACRAGEGRGGRGGVLVGEGGKEERVRGGGGGPK